MMAKFVFKLEALLNLKKQMEDSLKNELGKAIQKLEMERKKLACIESEKTVLILQINDKSSCGIAVGKLKEYGQYINLLNDRIVIQKENINFAANVVDRYREQLVKVIQEKEILENLKEKRYREYLKEQLKAEQKLIDEVISFKQNKIMAED